MHYRWSFPENVSPFIYYNFGNIVYGAGTYEEKLEAGEMMAKQFRKFCKPLGINETTYAAIEDNYLSLLEEMTSHLDEYKYFLGNRPSVGDFSIHGMIYAHLIRDARTGSVTKREVFMI
jgi:hypothetical protein